MMQETASVLGVKRKMYDIPYFSLAFSRLWLSLVTNTPREIVYPLVESLKHPMVVNPKNRVAEISVGKIPFRQAVIEAVEVEKNDVSKPSKRVQLGAMKQDVRSIQRVQLPHGWTADEVARYYVKWLALFLNPWVQTSVDNELNCEIGLIGDHTLLKLHYSADRSTTDRALYYISGGLLMDKRVNERGRLEFRKIPTSDEVIIAIHDYLPSMPWFVYYISQANMHLFIMWCFRRHMKKLSIIERTRLDLQKIQ